MKSPKILLSYLVFFILFGSFFYYKEFYLKKQEQLESPTIESTEESLNNVTNEEYTTTCCICGKEFYGNGYEEQMDGSFKELEYPYSNQLCSPSCARKASQKLEDITNKYGVDIDNQVSNSQQENDGYQLGNDGRVYEKNKCGLCKGTGYETGKNIATGKMDVRVCPMCDGRGIKSY